MRRHIYVFGYPSDCGGASTELWHLLKLWRRNGCDVSLIPTWSIPSGWQEKTDAVGCKTIRFDRHHPSLPDGSLVVSLSNAPFLGVSGKLRNCRLIYLPCMNYLNDPLESQVYREDGPFDAYVFQSNYQRNALAAQLHGLGVPVSRFHHIPGPLDIADFPFRPLHRNGSPFTFGRISRADKLKYRTDWWGICEDINNMLPVAVRCRVLGWHDSIAEKCGQPPEWCETLPKCSESTRDFLGSLHCVVQLGDIAENWPRVGLEAMAAGVPIVADRRGGWCEMIRDGETGFVVSSPQEAVEAVAKLASNEAIRLEITERARIAAEDLADETVLWAQWNKLFRELGH